MKADFPVILDACVLANIRLFSIEPLLVARRINEIAEAKNERPLDVLKRLRRDVPAFVDHFTTAAGLMLDEA